MSYLIILTIGPVQSYISQARRTQDLWQGSRILSYLAGVGVYKAHKEAGWENVIYPKLLPEMNLEDPYACVPNKIVIEWKGTEDGARQCAGEIKCAISEAWIKISQNTLTYFLNKSEWTTARNIWLKQEKNWLECYWVVAAYDEAKYAESLNVANSAMGARKLLRNFPQIDEGGRKCSITGEHEALRDVDNYVEFWTVRKAEQRNLALLGKHERLSAISTIKRFAHEEAYIKDTWEPINPALRIDHRFPSTSSIAAAPFKYAVLETLCNNPQDNGDLLVALQAFIAALLNCCDENKTIPVNTDRHPARNLFFTKHGNFNPEYFPMIQNLQGLTLSKGNVSDHEDLWATQFMCIDGDYLFEDTLIPKTISEYMPMIKAEGDALKRFEKKRLDELKPKVVEALKALKKFIGEASALGIPRPQPYVVVLSMDGDEMGKTLGVLQNARDHKRFSETLANFAKTNVQRIVEEEHLGRVVYAGGDDVLALLPVRDALQIAEALRSEFQETVGRIGITNHEGKPVTASTGLAYVHHTHNLQDAVRAANNAQSVAKEKYNRNAVAVEFLRRSGESRSMGFQWQTLDDSTLSNVIALTAEFGDGLSRSLPYDLAQMAYSMGNESVPEVARFAELTRVIRRRLPERNRDKAVTIAECVLRLINPHGKLESRWHNAQHWLELARFIAQTTVVEED